MASKNEKDGLMEKIVSLAKRRGFVFPGSEIYGGLANSWDYGPLGVELKNNIKQLWWNRFVHRRDDMVGLDSALILNPKVWEASGHLINFSDPLIECKNCHSRYRADQLVDQAKLDVIREELLNSVRDLINQQKKSISDHNLLIEAHNKVLESKKLKALDHEEEKSLNSSGEEILISVANSKLKEAEEVNKVTEFILNHLEMSAKYLGFVVRLYLNRLTPCPNCSVRDWEMPKSFNLMFKTFIGPAEEQANIAYLRPETAQGIFINFKNILDTSRRTLPFGVAQVGKAFRNEITPGNFIFRTREFEQMEIEYFIAPPARDDDWKDAFEAWRNEVLAWIKEVGIDTARVHELEVGEGDRAHYSKRTIDFEFDYPFGRKELYGLAYRTDFDLRNHFKEAPYRDPQTGEAFWPHVIEPSLGVDRTLLALLLSAHTEEGDRVFLKLPPKIAPYKAAVFPLLANKPQLVEYARKIYDSLRERFTVAWDDRGNIGKRYYAQDEVGTPFCITVDFETLGESDDAKGDKGLKDTVTVRSRDTGKQERVPVAKLAEFLHGEIYH